MTGEQKWELPGSGFKWGTDSGEQAGLPAVNFDAPRPEYPGVPKHSRTMRDTDAGSRAGAFTRAAIPAALDAAALPVTLAGRAAERLGYPNQAAHLSGQDALEAGEWLYRGVDPAQQRSEQSVERANYPASANLGEDVGAYVGSIKSGELAARGIGAGIRAGATAGRYLASEVNAAGGLKTVAQNLAQDTRGSVRLPVPSAKVTLTAEPAAAEHSWSTLGHELTEPVARGLVGEVPGLGATKIAASTKGKDVVVKALAPNGDTLIERAYRRGPDGELVAEHKLFALPPDQKGKGIGKAALAKQVETYDKLGVNRIEMSAEMDGRAVWPRMGFELQNPAELAPMKARFGKYLRDRGVPFDQAEALASAPTSIHELSLVQAPKPPRAPSGAIAPSGAAFLKQWPNPIALKADLSGASGEQLRHYLGVK